LARRLLRERVRKERSPVRRMVIVLTLASVLGAMLVLVGPATAQTSDAPSLTNLTVLHAKMTGEQVVPGPGDPDGVGWATIVLKHPDTVCHALTARRIAIFFAGINFGPPGVAGPRVVRLGDGPNYSGLSGGCTKADPELVANIAANPSEYYVDVDTPEYDNGALRGQLHR
jgi:hypothetical protein